MESVNSDATKDELVRISTIAYVVSALLFALLGVLCVASGNVPRAVLFLAASALVAVAAVRDLRAGRS